jgi:hypothetical protein
LVFPRPDGKPDLKLWRGSKTIAKRVFLDPDRSLRISARYMEFSPNAAML